jgi:hypothetical protein
VLSAGDLLRQIPLGMSAFGRFLPFVTGCFGLAGGHFLLVQNLAHSAISALRFSRRSERE